jgi:hypothetical protein
MLSKKAQAAGLVGIILLLIIFYIILLPPEEREELLGDEGAKGGKGETKQTQKNVTLLSVNPGRIDFLELDEVEHDIPSFTLFKTTEAKEIKKENPFIIRNGLFDKKFKNFTFNIENLDNVDNVLFSFRLKKHKGILTIKLNGNNIFENEITTVNVEPIILSKDFLRNKNTLSFSVSGVGIKFWTTNEYSFTDIKITADITDISRQESRNVFFVTEKELTNIEKATLKFNPDCRLIDVGILDIALNRRNIYSAVPDCGTLNKIEFSPGLIDIGENNIVFKTNKGSYLIDQIQVKTKLIEPTFPIYYFEVNETISNSIINGTADITLLIDFVDDDESKNLDLNINGHLTNIDQTEPHYDRRINSWVDEGNNYIEIRPKTTLNIVNLRVEVD